MAKQRPGTMIYFDLWDDLKDYTDEESGQILKAILGYGLNGEAPDFTDRGMKTLWRKLQSAIDRDAVAYDEKVMQRRYAAYCKKVRSAGEVPSSFEEWRTIMETNDNESYTVDEFRIPTTISSSDSSSNFNNELSTATPTSKSIPDITATSINSASYDNDSLITAFNVGVDTFRDILESKDYAIEQYLSLTKSSNWDDTNTEAQFKDVMALYKRFIEAHPTDERCDELRRLTSVLSADVVLHAINSMRDNNISSWPYLKAILNRYEREGIKTLAKVEEDDYNHWGAKQGDDYNGTSKLDRGASTKWNIPQYKFT